MATGVSKTKWNGQIDKSASSGDGLDFNGFRQIWPLAKTQSSNRLYFGDNLYVLKKLSEDQKIRGNVRLVYIDPPYSTNSVFQTRTLENGYADLLVGDEYISFLKERLVLLRDLLADDGSIYVHLDENMAFHAKVMLDNVFGKSNFKNFIVRQKCRPKNFTKKSFGNIVDYILFYTKTDKAVWNKPHEAWTEEKILKEYPVIESETGRRYKRVPLHAPGTRNGETGKPWRGMLPPAGKHWQFIPSKLDEFDKQGKIYWSKNGNPRRKVYLDESRGLSIQDIWSDFLDANNQNDKITGYPTEKNVNLLKRIIAASSNEGDLVLDCFVGSGTTLEAAARLKRNWVGIDIEKAAMETILKRFAHGTQKMGDYVQKENISQRPLFENEFSGRITDFALISEKDRVNELDGILQKWNGWINPK